MKHLDLFSGIGGFSLACQWAGIETIGFVEIDKYCQKVLRKRFPDVPIVEDIRDVEKIKGILANTGWREQGECRHSEQVPTHWNGEKRPTSKVGRPSSESHITASGQIVADARCQYDAGQLLERKHGKAVCEGTTDSPERPDSTPRNCVPKRRDNAKSPAILITAGFPCQPFSVAGKRGSTEDDCYLWPETLAVIKAVKPSWVLLENVTGIINLALDTVLSDLEGAGYSYETLIIPACAVNAWHRRDRVWVVAYSEGTRARQDNGGIRQRLGGIDRGQEAVVANTSERRLEEYRDKRGSRGLYREGQPDSPCKCNSSSDWWAVKSELGGMADGFSSRLDGYWDTEPAISRVATGVKNRVDRLKCLGNAIVPSVAYEIIKVISMTGERNG